MINANQLSFTKSKSCKTNLISFLRDLQINKRNDLWCDILRTSQGNWLGILLPLDQEIECYKVKGSP